MKIIVIVPAPFFVDRKTSVRVLEEALALERLGNSVIMISYHSGREIECRAGASLEVKRIGKILPWYDKIDDQLGIQKIILDLALLWKTCRVISKENPEIIHAHFFEGALIGYLAKKILFRKKLKLVVDLYEDPSRPSARFGFLKRRIARLGDFVVVGSKENAEEIKKIRNPEEVMLIPDGVNIESYLGLLPRDQQKKKLELPDKKMIVSYVGALSDEKGVSYFLEAMPLVLEKTSDVYFVIAGFPLEKADRFVAEHHLETNVRIVFAPNYFDLPEILNGSDVGIDPRTGKQDQPSRKSLQYLAAGLPVVCFDQENNRRFLGEGAYYASEISAQGIAEGILHFAMSPQEVKSRGEENKRRAVEFGWIRSGAKLELIYKRLLGFNGIQT
jgi:glycosyltransferase involved in cell wall biosynthesis